MDHKNSIRRNISKLSSKLSGKLLWLALLIGFNPVPLMAGTFNTITIQQVILDKIAGRLDILRATDAPHFRGYTAGDTPASTPGYAAGDLAAGCLSYGPFFFGNGERQDDFENNPGYESTTTGVGWAGDKSVALMNGITMRAGTGLAAAYAVTTPRGTVANANNSSNNSVKGWSFQPLIYASLEQNRAFVDGLFSIGFNRYSSTQFIPSINFSATASFNGFQYMAKARVGYVFTLATLSKIPFSTLEFTPLAALQYLRLRTHQFLQQGTNITVIGQNFTTAQVSFGGKLAAVNVPSGIYTEIHAMMLLDFHRIAAAGRIDNFAAFGPALSLPGNYAKTGANVGASSTLSYVEHLLFTAGLDFEGRSNFVGYTGWVRIRWLF